MTQFDSRKRWFALALIVTAQFMVVLDVAIVNVALPSIKTDLNFSQENLQWVITAYSILFGGVLLLGGRLADLLGRRRLFIAGILLFTVSSLLDGFAWSEGSLIAFRSLQGLGAALVSPAALSMLTTLFREGRERNVALGIWGAVSGSGGAAGVLLGGALTSAFNWSWIFFINVPVGLLVLALSPVLLRESRADLDHRHFDSAAPLDHRRIDGAGVRDDPRNPARLGDSRDDRPARRGRGAHRRVRRDRVALEGAAPADADLQAAVSDRGQRQRPAARWRDLRAVLPAHALHAAGPALLGAQDRRRVHRADAHDHRLLGRGAGPGHAPGRASCPDDRDARVGSRLILYAQLPVDGHYFWNLFPAFLLSGIGLALAFVPMSIGALTGVTSADAGVASGLINTSQQIGGAIGVAVATTIATTLTANYVDVHPGTSALSGGALTHGFQAAFYVLAGIAVFGAVVAAGLHGVALASRRGRAAEDAVLAEAA